MSTTIDRVREQGYIGTPNPNIASLHDELAAIVRKKNELLPMETQLFSWMDDRVSEIKSLVKTVEVSQQHGGAPLLDPTVLTWRHGLFIQGLPVPQLMLFDPFKNNVVAFTAKTRCSEGDPWAAYADVADAIVRKERDSDRTNIKLSFTYNGVIPDAARELIKAESGNHERIFLLVDTPREGWKYTDAKKERPPRVRTWDPLILGYTEGVFVVLGQFDPTPLELYVAQEFATKQLTTGS